MKCLTFTKNKSIKIKRKIDDNINLYSHCIDCGFKKIEIFNEEELSYFLESLI